MRCAAAPEEVELSDPPLLGCYDDPELLPAAEALARIDAHVGTLTESEEVELRNALGRVLACDLRSPIAVPGHTNSAMDGYAFAGSELPGEGVRSYRLLGTAWAGKPFAGDVPPGCTVRVMTGAMMPAGTDTVVMQEQVECTDDRISVTSGHRIGQNVREAGEDLEPGARVAIEPPTIHRVEAGPSGADILEVASRLPDDDDDIVRLADDYGRVALLEQA